MSFADAVKKCLSNYVTFSGRAPRSEFWWFHLFILTVGLVLALIDMSMFGTDATGEINGVFSAIFSLVVFLPALAVSIRRLHDLDMSGWWYLIALVPIVGALVLLFFFIQKGKNGQNRFGDDPLTA